MASAKRTEIMALISAYSGQKNVITIPQIYVKMTGDFESAALLNQILYWSERTTDPDGWFYKSYAEWEDELCLSQYQVSRCINGDKRTKKKTGLSEFGVETTVKKSKKGAPTVHYRIDRDVFIKALYKQLGIPEDEKDTSPIINNVDNPSSTMLINDNEQCQQSLRTEITTETTTNKNTIAVAPLPVSDVKINTPCKKQFEVIAIPEQPPQELTPEKPDIKELADAIEKHLDMHNGRQWHIAHMLQGTAKKGEYAEYGQYFKDKPVSADEFEKFIAYFNRECVGCSLAKAETIADWFGKYRSKAVLERENAIRRFNAQPRPMNIELLQKREAS